jgi:hypothetical protein
MLDKKELVDDYINMGVRMQLLLPVIIWKNCVIVCVCFWVQNFLLGIVFVGVCK